jgi:hypothetical protein
MAKWHNRNINAGAIEAGGISYQLKLANGGVMAKAKNISVWRRKK